MTEFSLQMDVTDDRWKFINQATIGPKMLGFRLTSRESVECYSEGMGFPILVSEILERTR